MGIQIGAERAPYFAKVGKDVVGCKTVREVAKLAQLDWEVEKRPIYLQTTKQVAVDDEHEDYDQVEDKFATVRKDTGKVLGIVGNQYEVVQNIEGFEFIDDVLGKDITFVKAGTHAKGTRVFIAAKAQSVEIEGDEIIPYILFTNSHDGAGTVTAIFTPMRQVCSNGLMLPAKGHQEIKIRIQHTKNVKDRLMIAKEVIKKNNKYLEALKAQAAELRNTEFSKEEFTQLATELAKVKEGEEMTKGQLQMIEDLQTAYQAEDLQKFEGTAWQAINAVADYDSHRIPARETGNNEDQFNRILYGMAVLQTAYQIIARMKGIRLY